MNDSNYRTILIDNNNWGTEVAVSTLVRAYTCLFWGAAWKELLAVRSPEGRVLQQFGTFDKRGEIFPEMLSLLVRAGIPVSDPNWPSRIWEIANHGELFTENGTSVSPYWTIASAELELRTFVSPRENGGYGGEILLVMEGSEVVGFTAYACAPGESGRAIANKRFSTERLYIPIDAASPSHLTVGEFLAGLYPDNDLAFGVFLDHAVSEASRGRGLGSRLFDRRLDRLLELGAEVIFGRTMVTEAPQYVGNYLKRGLTPVAADGTDTFSRAKHYFAVRRGEIRPRHPHS